MVRPNGEARMILISMMDQALSKGDQTIALLGLIVLALGAVWMFVRWLFGGPVQPDPWSEDVARELASDEAVPLCHRCFTPHHPLEHFCPNCGAPVGECTNLLPFPYLFSIGHMLRIGTSGEYKRSPLTIAGFLLVGIVEYSLFAPLYWVMFLLRLFRGNSTPKPAGQAPPPPAGPS